MLFSRSEFGTRGKEALNWKKKKKTKTKTKQKQNKNKNICSYHSQSWTICMDASRFFVS